MVLLHLGCGFQGGGAEDSWLVFTSLWAGPQVFPGDGGDGRSLGHHPVSLSLSLFPFLLLTSSSFFSCVLARN